MGFNTTLMILNDRLGDISRDKELGEKITQAINLRMVEDGPIEVSPGLFVVETHHADSYVVTAIGGNRAIHVGAAHWQTEDDKILDALTSRKDPSFEELKALAHKKGYRLITLRSKRRQKNGIRR